MTPVSDYIAPLPLSATLISPYSSSYLFSIRKILARTFRWIQSIFSPKKNADKTHSMNKWHADQTKLASYIVKQEKAKQRSIVQVLREKAASVVIGGIVHRGICWLKGKSDAPWTATFTHVIGNETLKLGGDAIGQVMARAFPYLSDPNREVISHTLVFPIIWYGSDYLGYPLPDTFIQQFSIKTAGSIIRNLFFGPQPKTPIKIPRQIHKLI